MRILDNILFYNEIDLIKCRIAEHYNFVDNIAIVESNQTFSRNPKPLYFQEYQSEFEEWKDKIIYRVLDGNELFTSERSGRKTYAEVNERRQRYYFERFEPDTLKNFDYIMYFDADEHINREHFPRVLDTLQQKPDVVNLYLRMFYYFLDTELDKGWSGDRIFRINKRGKFNVNILGNIGHHFSFLGGPEYVKKKIQDYSHCEQYKNMSDINLITSRILNLEDVLGRGKGFKDWHGNFIALEGNNHLPTYMRRNWDIYSKYTYHYFRENINK